MNELLARLERDLPGTLQLLERMVNMESPSLDKALVDRFARFLGSQFETIGGRVEYVANERFGDHLIARFGEHLIARFGGASKDRVLLLGHTDTVFAAGDFR